MGWTLSLSWISFIKHPSLTKLQGQWLNLLLTSWGMPLPHLLSTLRGHWSPPRAVILRGINLEAKTLWRYSSITQGGYLILRRAAGSFSLRRLIVRAQLTASSANPLNSTACFRPSPLRRKHHTWELLRQCLGHLKLVPLNQTRPSAS